MSRGAPRAPITYEGEYDPTRTYLPRQVAHVTAGATCTVYLSTATTTGDDPATSPTSWLPLGGDSTHDGTGTNSTAVGTLAKADHDSTVAVGDQSWAGADSGTALGAAANVFGIMAVAVGNSAEADGFASIAVGTAAIVGADNAIVIGHGLSNWDEGTCKMRVNDLELVSVRVGDNAGSFVLRSPDNTRWRIGVDNSGALTIATA